MNLGGVLYCLPRLFALHSWASSQILANNVHLSTMRPTNQTRSIVKVMKAVAGKHLIKRITANVHGEILDLGDTVNRRPTHIAVASAIR